MSFIRRNTRFIFIYHLSNVFSPVAVFGTPDDVTVPVLRALMADCGTPLVFEFASRIPPLLIFGFYLLPYDDASEQEYISMA